MRVRGWYRPGCSWSSGSALGAPSAGGRVVDLRAEQRFEAEAEALRFLRHHGADCDRAPGRRRALAVSSEIERGGARKAGMQHKVFVDGQEGTTGLRIHEYLAQRDDIEVLRAAPERRKDPAERARLLNAADVAFLCLPDAAAREAAAMVTNPRTCIIDASTAHRTAARLGLRHAGAGARPARAAARQQADREPGLPRERASSCCCGRSSTPASCRPTLPVSATSITGYSGGGRKMIEQYEAGGDARLDAPRPYALSLQHKHVPEMMAHTGLDDAAALRARRRQLLQGAGGQRAAAPVATAAAARRRQRSSAPSRSATPASRSFA